MSLVSFIGPRPNIFDLEGSSRRKRLEVRQPILTNQDLEKIRCISHFEDRFDTKTLDMTYPAEQGAGGMQGALDRLCERAEAAVHGGYNIIVLSDRMVGPDRVPIPSLLATAAVHHHLIRKGLRTSVGLVAGDGRAARGASFLLPRRLRRGGDQPLSRLRYAGCDEGRLPRGGRRRRDRQALHQVRRQGHPEGHVQDGHLDLPVLLRRADLRRRGSASRTSWQQYFFGTSTTIEGVGLAEIAEETVRRHRDAFGDAPVYRTALDVGGEYAYRIRGEDHVWTPDTVAMLQHAVRLNAQDRYREYAQLVNEQEGKYTTIRGLFRIKTAEERGAQPVPLDEVEPAAQLVRRFRDGRDVVRLHLEGSARDAGHRHEPDRRQVEHRRRRRGIRALRSAARRPLQALGHQAGRVGPLRRHGGVPRQLRRHADQDRAGRQARRGRAVARPQGRCGDRQGAPFDTGRRPDLAAAAPRHLLDRGPRPAHLRPEERQPGGRRLGEARLGSGRRHRRGRRRQGARRPHHHLRLRGRDGGKPPHLAQARGLALGNGPGRDAADARAEPPARPRRAAGRRRAAHGPRRRDRRACWERTSSASRRRR